MVTRYVCYLCLMHVQIDKHQQDWDDDDDVNGDVDDESDNDDVVIVCSDDSLDEVSGVKDEPKQESNPEPKEFRVVLSPVDLSSLTPVPDRENAFFLPEEYLRLDPMRLRKKFGLKDLHIRLKNLTFLRCDRVYEVVSHNDLHPEFLIPETILKISRKSISLANGLSVPVPEPSVPEMSDPPLISYTSANESNGLQELPFVSQLPSQFSEPTTITEEYAADLAAEALEKFKKQPHFLIGSGMFESPKSVAKAPVMRRPVKLKPLPVTACNATSTRPSLQKLLGLRFPTSQPSFRPLFAPPPRPEPRSSTRPPPPFRPFQRQPTIPQRYRPALQKRSPVTGRTPFPTRAVPPSVQNGTVIDLVDDETSPAVPARRLQTLLCRAPLPKESFIDLLSDSGSEASGDSDLEIIETKGDESQTNGAKAQTNGDIVQTNADIVQTNGDVVQTNGDVVQTNGDEAQTNGDVSQTNGDKSPEYILPV